MYALPGAGQANYSQSFTVFHCISRSSIHLPQTGKFSLGILNAPYSIGTSRHYLNGNLLTSR